MVVPNPDVSRLPLADQVAEEEVRFAVVLNGGVSLAIWMGGVVSEIDRCTRRDSVYGRILSALHARARADVIAGTSAGGINGAALACAQVRPDAEFDRLLETWATRGAIRELLRSPWTGDPPSLLKGDEFFLPELTGAFRQLLPESTREHDLHLASDRPISLRLTTTLLTPEPEVSTDSLGRPVVQPRQRGRFTFRRPWSRWDARQEDHFSPNGPIWPTAGRLGLAARCTASFPVAFEPVFVPVNDDPPDELHPDMAPVANFDRSRWCVDGGVLMNTPFGPVLDDIASAPADLQVRRLLLLVVPDPFTVEGSLDQPDRARNLPSVRDTLVAVATAPFNQSVDDDLEAWRRHNAMARARRDARTDLLQAISVQGLEPLAESLFPSYVSMRLRRAAASVATEIATQTPEEFTGQLAAQLAQPQTPHPSFIPRSFHIAAPDGHLSEHPAGTQVPAPEWTWGLAPLERLTVALLDLLKRLIWALPDVESRRGVAALRAEAHEMRQLLAGARRDDEAFWRARLDEPPTALLEAAERWSSELLIHVPGEPEARPIREVGTEVAGIIIGLGAEAAGLVPAQGTPGDPLMGDPRLRHLAEVFRRESETAQARSAALQRALALEVATVCLLEAQDTGSEDVVELVQVSTNVPHTFAGHLTPTDRVAGLRLGHFAAFLKESWRVNDWIWGALDGANRLITALLDPQRLARLVRQHPAGPAAGAAAVLSDLGVTSQDACYQAGLDALVDPDLSRDDLAPLTEHLIDLRAAEILAHYEERLAQAVRTDLREGANPRSNGARWLGLRTEAQP